MIKILKRKKKKNNDIVFHEDDTDVVKMTKMLAVFEKMNLGEYIQYLGKPWHIIWSNILVGISRGIGLTIGAALVIILIVKLLTLFIGLKFPWLSDASAQLLQVIKTTPGAERFVQVVEQSQENARKAEELRENLK